MTGSASFNPISEALRSQDPGRASVLLRSNSIGLLVVESGGALVPAVLTNSEGDRAIAAFTGPDTFDLWGRPDQLSFIPASQLADVAQRQGVSILIDPSGPAAASFSAAEFQSLLDGVTSSDEGQMLVGDLDVRMPAGDAGSVRAAVASNLRPGTEAFVFERVVSPERGVLTVGYFGPELEAATLAHALSSETNLPLLDVVVISADQRDVLVRKLGAAQVHAEV